MSELKQISKGVLQAVSDFSHDVKTQKDVKSSNRLNHSKVKLCNCLTSLFVSLSPPLFTTVTVSVCQDIML